MLPQGSCRKTPSAFGSFPPPPFIERDSQTIDRIVHLVRLKVAVDLRQANVTREVPEPFQRMPVRGDSPRSIVRLSIYQEVCGELG
jgi:hypothetical protein